MTTVIKPPGLPVVDNEGPSVAALRDERDFWKGLALQLALSSVITHEIDLMRKNTTNFDLERGEHIVNEIESALVSDRSLAAIGFSRNNTEEQIIDRIRQLLERA